MWAPSDQSVLNRLGRPAKQLQHVSAYCLGFFKIRKCFSFLLQELQCGLLTVGTCVSALHLQYDQKYIHSFFCLYWALATSFAQRDNVVSTKVIDCGLSFKNIYIIGLALPQSKLASN